MLIGEDSDTLYYQEMEKRINHWNDIQNKGTYFRLPIQFADGFSKTGAFLVNSGYHHITLLREMVSFGPLDSV